MVGIGEVESGDPAQINHQNVGGITFDVPND